MRVSSGFASLRKKPRAVAVGVFDGVHLGHRKILLDAVRRAKAAKISSVVVTFDPHPSRVLGRKGGGKKILSLAHRLRFFEKLGLDEAVVIRFNRAFSRMSRERFLEKLLIGALGMRSLSVGDNFRFGRGGKGDARFLAERSRALGFGLSLVPPVKKGGRAVSSTRIREKIERGDLAGAAALLGRPVSVYGNVVKGRGRGRKLGFPTANVNPHHEALPPAGVYAVRGFLGTKKMKGVLHLGARPTFGEKDPSIEVHFPGFRGNLYGKELELVFEGRVRGVKRFPGLEALKVGIREDIRKSLKILK